MQSIQSAHHTGDGMPWLKMDAFTIGWTRPPRDYDKWRELVYEALRRAGPPR